MGNSVWKKQHVKQNKKSSRGIPLGRRPWRSPKTQVIASASRFTGSRGDPQKKRVFFRWGLLRSLRSLAMTFLETDPIPSVPSCTWRRDRGSGNHKLISTALLFSIVQKMWRLPPPASCTGKHHWRQCCQNHRCRSML